MQLPGPIFPQVGFTHLLPERDGFRVFGYSLTAGGVLHPGPVDIPIAANMHQIPVWDREQVFDFFVGSPAVTNGPPVLSIELDGLEVEIRWDGDAILQRSSDLENWADWTAHKAFIAKHWGRAGIFPDAEPVRRHGLDQPWTLNLQPRVFIGPQRRSASDNIAEHRVFSKGTAITILSGQREDYISLTDIAKYKNPDHSDDVIRNWLRNRDTVEFLGVWERLNNPGFNPVEFDGIRIQAGLNSFTLTPKQWIEKTGAAGIISSAGRYGGTFAHKDIAF